MHFCKFVHFFWNCLPPPTIVPFQRKRRSKETCFFWVGGCFLFNVSRLSIKRESMRETVCHHWQLSPCGLVGIGSRVLRGSERYASSLWLFGWNNFFFFFFPRGLLQRWINVNVTGCSETCDSWEGVDVCECKVFSEMSFFWSSPVIKTVRK